MRGLKSAAALLTRYYTIWNLWDLKWDTVHPCGSCHSKTAKCQSLRSDKRWSQSSFSYVYYGFYPVQPRFSSFWTFKVGSFAASSASRMHSISFESLYKFWLIKYTVKSTAALLRSVISTKSIPHLFSAYLVTILFSVRSCICMKGPWQQQ